MSGECSSKPPVRRRNSIFYHNTIHHPQQRHRVLASITRTTTTTTITTILAVLFSLSMLFCCTAGIGFEQPGRHNVLDILENLNPSHHSQPVGVQYTKGPDNRRWALLFDGESSRHITLSDLIATKAQRLLHHRRELSFICTVRQEVGDSGTLLAFSEKHNSRPFYLEIESSGRRNEIRLHYSHMGEVRTETFAYRLADGTWHKLSVTLSGDEITLFVDCNRIYKRVIPSVDRPGPSSSLSVFLGQRNHHQALFRGALQDVKIIGQAHGYLVQCPKQHPDCPTCKNIQELENQMKEMSVMYKELTTQLTRAQERLGELEQCECSHHCHENGTKHKNGDEWNRDSCTVCKCMNGTVECRSTECPTPACKNPVHRDGECCPVCTNYCIFGDKRYAHGKSTKLLRACVTCTCKNGRMECDRRDPTRDCPKLDCPPSEIIEIHGICCPVCNGTDFCGQGHRCHANASCINLATKSVCQCHPGYDGDGSVCHDIDECLQQGGSRGHLCTGNTICLNTPGSYRCDCKQGYSRLGSHECQDNQDCFHGDKKCHSNAQCIVNHEGDNRCQCNDGYEGDGTECKPHCVGGCQSGGRCVAPDTCDCRDGYIGLNCQLDINECELGISKCQGHSECINLPGWYRCDCLEGYHSTWPDNHFGNLCHDINECEGEGEGHACNPSMQCINTVGGYKCECTNPDSCHTSCLYEGNEYKNGLTWMSRIDTCKHCKCEIGRAVCHHLPCDCSDPNVDLKCCPSCDEASKCTHQEIPKEYNSGDRWIYKCQTCECLDGEIDCWPMECPVLTCPNAFRRPGDCCPQCEDFNLCSSSQTFSIGGQDLSQTSCSYQGEEFFNGDGWNLESDPCTFCSCKAGHICCSYDNSCSQFRYLPPPNIN